MDAYQEGWAEVSKAVRGRCPGCPRDPDKMPLLFDRVGDPSRVRFVIVSQEPGHWLRTSPLTPPEDRLHPLCRGQGTADEVRRANPLSKVLEVFGPFDPSSSAVYWTHALKCVPSKSDRDVNKEWRKAASRCREHFISELKLLGKEDLNLIAFGKYALEMCLNVLDGQDIDQELSISEHMQTVKLPLQYKYRFKDGTSKNISLFVLTNPSAEVVKVLKSGGKLTTEEVQEREVQLIKAALGAGKGR